MAKRNATPRAETEQHYSPSARISPPKNVATPTSSPNKMEVEDEMTLHSTPFAVRRKAALLMALALSVHLGGRESLCFDHVVIICNSINATCHIHIHSWKLSDELARGGVVALFTSDEFGFGRSGGGGLSALPLAVGCVSPFSILVLWVYGRSLRWGPARALRTHTLIATFVPVFCATVLKMLERSAVGERRWSQYVIFFAFVFQVNLTDTSCG